jgi:hypothetical protein
MGDGIGFMRGHCDDSSHLGADYSYASKPGGDSASTEISRAADSRHYYASTNPRAKSGSRAAACGSGTRFLSICARAGTKYSAASAQATTALGTGNRAGSAGAANHASVAYDRRRKLPTSA